MGLMLCRGCVCVCARVCGCVAWRTHARVCLTNTVVTCHTATSERGESICYDLSDPSHLDTFPSLAFRLDGTNLVVPPGGLFQTMDWFSHPGRCVFLLRAMGCPPSALTRGCVACEWLWLCGCGCVWRYRTQVLPGCVCGRLIRRRHWRQRHDVPRRRVRPRPQPRRVRALHVCWGSRRARIGRPWRFRHRQHPGQLLQVHRCVRTVVFGAVGCVL